MWARRSRRANAGFGRCSSKSQWLELPLSGDSSDRSGGMDGTPLGVSGGTPRSLSSFRSGAAHAHCPRAARMPLICPRPTWPMPAQFRTSLAQVDRTCQTLADLVRALPKGGHISSFGRLKHRNQGFDLLGLLLGRRRCLEEVAPAVLQEVDDRIPFSKRA